MKKIVSAILAVALVLSLCTVMSFAAEDYVVDLNAVESVASNPGEHAPHGYAGVTTLLLDYGNVITLGELDLGAYSACEVTYATDLGYEAQKEGMKIPANFSLKSNNVCIGAATQDPATDGLIAQADCINADRDNPHNPDGANWDKDERVCSIDLSNVDYSGEVWLSHFNSVGNQALIVEIRFVAKADETPSGEVVLRGRSFDAFVTNYVDITTGEFTIVDLGPVNGSDGSINNIGYYGWVGFEEAIDSFGYQINDNAPVFDSAFSFTTEDAIKLPENGGQYGQRFLIVVPTSDLKGTNTIKAVVKLASGTVVALDGTTIGKDLPNTIVEYTGPAAPETQPDTQPATQPETVPQTGDATVAMFAVIAVLAIGAAVVFMKKKVF